MAHEPRLLGEAGQEPPVLEVTPFGADPADRVSCLATSDRVVAVGTASGDLLLFDIAGNELRRASDRHRGPVGAVALTPDSEVVASVGLQDARVVVDGIALNAKVAFSFKTAVSDSLVAVALDPAFGIRSERLVHGSPDGRLILHSRKWIGGSDTTLDQASAPIAQLLWTNAYILSATPAAIRVFSSKTDQFLSQCSLEQMDFTPRIALLPSDDRIFLALPQSVEIRTLTDRGCLESSPALSPYQLDHGTPAHQFLDASPFGSEGIMTLQEGNEPDTGVFTLSGCDGSRTSITVPMVAALVRMVHVRDGDPLILVWSRADDEGESSSILAVRNFPKAKKVQWLLERGRYRDAVSVAQGTPRGQLRSLELDIAKIWLLWLENLLQAQEFPQLGQLLAPAIDSMVVDSYHNLNKRKEAASKYWNTWIITLIEQGQVSTAADSLPETVGPYPPEIPGLYDKVLGQLVLQNPKHLAKILAMWNSELFTVAAVTNAVESELRRQQRTSRDQSPLIDQLRETLVVLYSSQSRFHDTLKILIDKRNPEVFKFIRMHSLFQVMHEKSSLEALFRIDSSETAILLSSAPAHLVAPQSVVATLKLSEHREWCYLYLWRLFKQCPSQIPDLHQDLVGLVARHGTEDDLMSVLTSSTDYNLEEASHELELAKEDMEGRSFSKERAYILGKMGDLPGALSILLHETEDFQSAISLASQSDDVELWSIVMDYAKKSPKLVSSLLDRPRGGPDPLAVVKLIEDGVVIDGLHSKLQRVLKEVSLDRSLQEGCASILEHSTEQLAVDFETLMRSGR